MKKLLVIITFFCFSNLSAQTKQPDIKIINDTTIQIILNINEYRSLLSAIDEQIDSKKITKEIIMFIQQRARIMDVPKKVDIPKEEKPKQ